MNEQAWKEQAARVLCGADSCWDYDTLPEQRSEISATEDSFCKDYWRKLAAALYPIVQQAIAAERGEPVAAGHCKISYRNGIRAAVTWLYERVKIMNDPLAKVVLNVSADHMSKELIHNGESLLTPAAASPTEAQIRAEAYERCAKVAEGYVGSTPPRYESGIERRATTSQQADNCLNAIKVRAATIAAAIRSLKEADNGAGNECICPKCGLRHGGKVDSGAVF